MNEKNLIKDLETQARNTKNLMDSLMISYIGLTAEELIRLASGKREDNTEKEVRGDNRDP